MLKALHPLTPPAFAVPTLVIPTWVVLPVLKNVTVSDAGVTVTVVGVAGGPTWPGVILPMNGLNAPVTVNTAPDTGLTMSDFGALSEHVDSRLVNVTSNGVATWALAPGPQDIVESGSVDGICTVNVVTPVVAFTVAPVMNATASPILMRGVPAAFATCTVVVPPSVPVPTPTICGLRMMKVNVGPAAESPLSTFVTTIGPVMFAHAVSKGAEVMAITCVPETLIGCAATPPMTTAIGSLNPTTSIVTRVPPAVVPCVVPAAVICILAM